MKRVFISSVQKEFERERAAIKRMIESDPILKPYFSTFVFEIDAPASDKPTQQVYLKEIEKSDIYLVLIGNRYGYCRGLTDLLKECKAKGLRKPLLEEASGRFRIVIWRPKAAAKRGGNALKGSLKGSLKSSLKSSQKIIELLAENPHCTYDSLAEIIGISRRAVTKQIQRLRQSGRLRRIGPDKGGHWEVLPRQV